MSDLRGAVRATPRGALAAAFSEVAKQATEPGAWWRISPLLAASGIDHQLRQLGYHVQRNPRKGGQP